jgi:hypothetical protein
MCVLGWNLHVSAWQAIVKNRDIERKKEKIAENLFRFLAAQILYSRYNQSIRTLPQISCKSDLDIAKLHGGFQNNHIILIIYKTS